MTTIGESMARTARENVEKINAAKIRIVKSFFASLKRHVITKADRFSGTLPKISVSLMSERLEEIGKYSSHDMTIPVSVIEDFRRSARDKNNSKEIEELIEWCREQKLRLLVEDTEKYSENAMRLVFVPTKEVLEQNGLEVS